MESLHKNILLMLEFLKAPFLVLHFSDVICDIAIYADDTTLYSKCDWASDLQDSVDLGKKWLVDFSAGKTQLVSFDQSNNSGSIDVKMGGSVLEGKSSEAGFDLLV